MSKNKNRNKGVHPKNWNHGVHPNFGQKPLKCIWVTSLVLKIHYFLAKCFIHFLHSSWGIVYSQLAHVLVPGTVVTIQKTFPVWISHHRFSLCFTINIVHLHFLGCFCSFFGLHLQLKQPKKCQGAMVMVKQRENPQFVFFKFWTVVHIISVVN